MFCNIDLKIVIACKHYQPGLGISAYLSVASCGNTESAVKMMNAARGADRSSSGKRNRGRESAQALRQPAQLLIPQNTSSLKSYLRSIFLP